MPNPLVAPEYQNYIDTRQVPGQQQTEFYNKESGLAFTPKDLANFVQAQYGRNDVNESNVFSILATPSRSQQLGQITNELNTLQNDTFNEQSNPDQRRSSTIQQNIDAENKNLTDALAEFNTLKTKLTSLDAPNYEQTYNDLRTKAGVPGIENDFANNQKTIRELPYVNRQNFGNAGVATEGQLAADTEQKGIPLEIQQANLLDRLKLAQDFVNNSLKFKELDSNAARESLGNAINLVLQSVDLSRQRIGDYQGQQDRIEARAAEFRQANNIMSRFYKLPGTDLVFDSQTLEALPFEEYKKRGGVGELGQDSAFADVQEVQPQTVQEERAIVADMANRYVDAGITLNDTLAVAQSKILKSRIYQDQVRGPVGSGGGGSAINLPGIGNLTNTQIDNISPVVNAFRNEAIVQNYNTIAEGYQFVKSLSDTTKNPADDQALIYALAKALDPGSVVREGEYATVQKYAQSLAQSYGKSVTQAINGSGFLSQEARSNIKATIQSRYNTAAQNYNNIYNETARRVELVGGLPEGAGTQFLNNYAGGYTVEPAKPSYGPATPTNITQQQDSQQSTNNQSWWGKTINFLFGDF